MDGFDKKEAVTTPEWEKGRSQTFVSHMTLNALADLTNPVSSSPK